MKRPLLVVLLIMTVSAFAQTSHKRKPLPAAEEKGIDVTNDPAFKVEFQNDKVRVLRLQLAPGASTQKDEHNRDYLVEAIGPASFQVTGDVTHYRMDMQPEELQVITGGWAHTTTNVGTAPLEVVEVEFAQKLNPEHALCGLNTHACKSGELGNEIGQYSRAVLFETTAVQVMKTEISAAATIPEMYEKRETLVLAMTDLNLRDQSLDSEDQKGPVEIQQKPGDVLLWLAKYTHKLTNVSKEDERFYSLELK